VNPYDTPTDLIFHKDLTFEGLAARAASGWVTECEQSHLFFTAGAHPCRVALSGEDKWLVLPRRCQPSMGEASGCGLQRVFLTISTSPDAESARQHDLQLHGSPVRAARQHVFRHQQQRDQHHQSIGSGRQIPVADLNATYTLPIGPRTFRFA